MDSGVMFGVIISIIVDALVPKNFENIVVFSVTEPMKLHVPCFGSFHLDVAVNKTIAGGVVSFYGGW